MNNETTTQILVKNWIQSASIEELKEVVHDDLKFESLLSDKLNKNEFESKKTPVLDEVKSLAVNNLKRKDEINLLKSDIVDLSEKCQSFDLNEKLIDIRTKLGYDLTSESILKQLRKLTSETEAASEEILERLFRKEIAIETFLNEYMRSRIEMYKRKFKTEELAKQLKAARKQSNEMAAGPCYPTIVPSQPFAIISNHFDATGADTPPYPVASVPMPMPSFFK